MTRLASVAPPSPTSSAAPLGDTRPAREAETMPGAITPTLAEPDAHADDDMAALPRAGDRVGGFVVERTLGAGAMGIVLLARDAELQRHVAVKLLVPRHGEDLEAQRRLLREAQSVAQLQHPNVVALHQVGMHEGRVFLVMEYVDGGTLRQWASGETRTWREIVGVYLQAAAGLAAAHAAGLVHRDFKPVQSNTPAHVR